MLHSVVCVRVCVCVCVFPTDEGSADPKRLELFLSKLLNERFLNLTLHSAIVKRNTSLIMIRLRDSISLGRLGNLMYVSLFVVFSFPVDTDTFCLLFISRETTSVNLMRRKYSIMR